MWEQSMEGMKGLVMKTTNPTSYTYLAERSGQSSLQSKVRFNYIFMWSMILKPYLAQPLKREV